MMKQSNQSVLIHQDTDEASRSETLQLIRVGMPTFKSTISSDLEWGVSVKKNSFKISVRGHSKFQQRKLNCLHGHINPILTPHQAALAIAAWIRGEGKDRKRRSDGLVGEGRALVLFRCCHGERR